MNERERRQIVDDYLRWLAEALGDGPAARRELIEDVRGHIEEAWAGAPEHNRAALLNILERLGEPEALAREEYERLGLTPAGREGEDEVLSWAAVVITVVFWPLGVVLSWFSSRWSVCDKAIATILPVLGLLLGLTLSAATFIAVERGVAQPAPATVERTNPAPESAPTAPAPDRGSNWGVLATALAFYGFLGAPLTTAAYLALRLWRRTRSGRTLAPLLVGTFLTAMLLLVLFLPAQVAPGAVQVVPRPASTSIQELH
ncbi:MAG: hypothetical protein M1401_08855 [Chloroflexi bacterium]|nr:hypothetical protein [Chloroflexota bacterium]